MKEASKKAEGLGMEDYALEVEWSQKENLMESYKEQVK